MKELDVVVLLEDLPSLGLVRGNQGTIVATWAPDVFEVEFVNRSGETYAMADIPAAILLEVRDVPQGKAS